MAPKKSSTTRRGACTGLEDGDAGQHKRKRSTRSSQHSSSANPETAAEEAGEKGSLEQEDPEAESPRKRTRAAPPKSTTPPSVHTEKDDDTSQADTHVEDGDVQKTSELTPKASGTASGQQNGVDVRTTGSSMFNFDKIVVNVATDHTGPILIQLDIPARNSADKAESPLKNPHIIARAQPSSGFHNALEKLPDVPDSTSHVENRTGFLSLSSELRNMIYELVFVADKPLNFRLPINFQRSAALLRTCKQVHSEASAVLYGANQFAFGRRVETYGSYWTAEWSEMGFKPVRRFLKMIGEKNVTLLRTVTLLCTDAPKRLNPNLVTADSRRFTNDPALLSSLRCLGRHGQLDTIALHSMVRLCSCLFAHICDPYPPVWVRERTADTTESQAIAPWTKGKPLSWLSSRRSRPGVSSSPLCTSQ